MKRVYIAVVLLALVIGGCFYTIDSGNKAAKTLLFLTDAIEEAYRNGKTEEAEDLSEQLVSLYPSQTYALSLFLPHDDLTEIEKSIVGLPTALHYGNEPEFLVELTRCRMLIYKLRDQQLPLLPNIL